MNAKSEDLPFTRFIHGFRAKSMECKRLTAAAVYISPFGVLCIKGCLLRDSGYRIQVTGYRLQDSRFRLQDSGFRLQDSGYKIQVTGYKIQVAGFKIQVIDAKWRGLF